jgi:FkbM family methyltransferase
MIKIAIIDRIGLCYDGDTLEKSGLGGSESAVILMSEQLKNIGFDVTVFNNCRDSTHSSPGVYRGVRYIDNADAITHTESYDIVIVSRTVEPFVNQRLYPFVHHTPLRIFWMHDTFCWGDNILEDLVVSGKISWIFTLSDFHTTYVLNCHHGKRRNYEVLKRRVFQTRNGAVNYIPEVDLTKKDRNHFVFNASVTKGLIPLLENIWPELKRRIPSAKLTVIGGYYRFRENSEPDEQEKQLKRLIDDPSFKDLSVTFTDVIPQRQIAEILAGAGFMIYPGLFPETFGISSLEALLYNTPLITTRFGALEETAIEKACYLKEYAIGPNVLFEHIDLKKESAIFVDIAEQAYHNTYLHQQKQNYCSVVKDIAGWDTVALEWKQFFYRVMGKILPVDEYRRVKRISEKVARVFGRVNRMPAVAEYSSSGPQLPITVITTVRNSEKYIENCILSVAHQDYDNYRHVIIDDCSTDNTRQRIWDIVFSLPYDRQDKIKVVENLESVGAVRNQVDHIRLLDNNQIVMIVDGDDWLVNNNTLFHFYNDLYQQGAEFTYGSCWSLADNIPLVAQDYPESVKQRRDYRNYRFNWIIPYTHLRTFRKHLINSVNDNEFLDKNGEWYRAGGDGAVFYSLIERANPDRIVSVKEIMYNYNDLNPLNDYKVNSEEQNKNARDIMTKQKPVLKPEDFLTGAKLEETTNTQDVPEPESRLFTVVIPTMWRAKEVTISFLHTLVAHPRVGEILIIDNDNSRTPYEPVLKHSKIKLLDFGENIYVNPAWNQGVKEARYDFICILNDDLRFDVGVFDRVAEYLNDRTGVIGLNPGLEQFGQPVHNSKDIKIVEWPRSHTFGFGCLMFVYKPNWIDIPEELKIYYGDNFIFDVSLRNQKKNYIITDVDFETKYAQTTSDTNITDGFLESESEIYTRIMNAKAEPESKLVTAEKKQRILVAIPTAKYIEVETFKSLWDLTVPDGYELDFQYFYGYNISQIRNLIAEWAKRYDYLLSVDSDIILPRDSLVKMLAADKDIISGIYIQRKPGEQILEVYMDTSNGGCTNIPYKLLENLDVVEIAACGMGCALIKGDVFRRLEYPHFFYKEALDHRNTVSEDVYFCMKARKAGFTVWADPSIRCDHIGSTTFSLDTQAERNIEHVASQDLLPRQFVEYMKNLDIKPKVIYDVGSCVLHWESHAGRIWPDASIYLFEANPDVRKLYDRLGKTYHLGVLSDQDNKLVKFYRDPMNLGGNSYYRENTVHYNETHAESKVAMTLDTVVKTNGWPLPDLMKMDVQGAELDIIRGAQECMKNCSDVFLECQHQKYNDGAPLFPEVVAYMKSIGFDLVGTAAKGEIDGDYHFKKIGL